jgi:hypothetical protein
MRFTYPKPPPRIRELAYQALNMELLRHPHHEQTPAKAAAPGHGHVPDLHKVFILPASAVAQGKDLRAAEQIGWHDVVVLSGVSHSIEVAQGRKRDSAVYVMRGSDVDSELATLTALLGSRKTGTFEVRVLRIPSIATFVFWLYAKDRRNDRLVPVISSASQLQLGREYSPSVFFRAVRATAVQLTARAEAQLIPAKKKAQTKPRNSAKRQS